MLRIEQRVSNQRLTVPCMQAQPSPDFALHPSPSHSHTVNPRLEKPFFSFPLILHNLSSPPYYNIRTIKSYTPPLPPQPFLWPVQVPINSNPRAYHLNCSLHVEAVVLRPWSPSPMRCCSHEVERAHAAWLRLLGLGLLPAKGPFVYSSVRRLSCQQSAISLL